MYLRQSTKKEENLFDTLNGGEPGAGRFDGYQENAYLCFEDFLMCCHVDACVWLKDIVPCFCWTVRISGNF